MAECFEDLKKLHTNSITEERLVNVRCRRGRRRTVSMSVGGRQPGNYWEYSDELDERCRSYAELYQHLLDSTTPYIHRRNDAASEHYTKTSSTKSRDGLTSVGRRFSRSALLHGIMRAPRRSLDNALRIRTRIAEIRAHTSAWLQRLAILSISIIAILFIALRTCKSLNAFPGGDNQSGFSNRTVDSIVESLFGHGPNSGMSSSSSTSAHESSYAIARSVLFKFIAVALLAFLFTGSFVCERLFACQITLEHNEILKDSPENVPLYSGTSEDDSDADDDEEFFWNDYELSQPCSCGCSDGKEDSNQLTVISSSLKINLLYLLPLRTISRVWGHMNVIVLPRSLRRPIYTWYSQTFGCNLSEIHPSKELEDYQNLSEFFRRQLAEGVRPIGDSPLVSPADGRIVQLEEIGADGFIGSVKGVHYSVNNFLGPQAVPQKLRPGNKLYGAVIYLAPGDYHRFHSPADWSVKYRRHFSGRLFSVAPTFVAKFPDLFSVQERVAYFGQWQHGFFSMTAVGATNVGTVNVYFDHDLQTNQFINSMNYRTEKLFKDDVTLSRGELFGEFNLGSTIVLVFEAPANDTKLACELLGNKVKYGENILEILQ